MKAKRGMYIDPRQESKDRPVVSDEYLRYAFTSGHSLEELQCALVDSVEFDHDLFYGRSNRLWRAAQNVALLTDTQAKQ